MIGRRRRRHRHHLRGRDLFLTRVYSDTCRVIVVKEFLSGAASPTISETDSPDSDSPDVVNIIENAKDAESPDVDAVVASKSDRALYVTASHFCASNAENDEGEPQIEIINANTVSLTSSSKNNDYHDHDSLDLGMETESTRTNSPNREIQDLCATINVHDAGLDLESSCGSGISENEDESIHEEEQNDDHHSVDLENIELIDPSTIFGKKFDPATTKYLMMKGANQPRANEPPGKLFPKTKVGSYERSFSELWYEVKIGKTHTKRAWLSYSPIKDAVFCRYCYFFSKISRENTFTEVGFKKWKKAGECFSKHEKSQSHIDATIDFINFCTSTFIDKKLLSEAAKLDSERKRKVQKNRKVMGCLIDITIFLAEQGLAFRGHRDEIMEDMKPKGNFLALVRLLSKYDGTLEKHKKEIEQEKLKRKSKKKDNKRDVSRRKSKKKATGGRGNLATFLSWESQNKIISGAGKKITEEIIQEVKEAGMFNAVGQSYDGASVMQGKYKGVKSLVQKENPQCLFIWTFDHVLNLVVMEACGSSLAAKSLFGTLEKVYAFFSASRKRSDELEEVQKKYKIAQLHRPQRNCMSAEHSSETITDAEALLHKICSFETVLTAHLFKQMFAITNPASLYLQSEKIDILTALRLIETAEVQLGLFRNEFASVLEDAKNFCVRHDLQQQTFTEKRVRKKKRMPDENYTAIGAINRRFTAHKAILTDFALLDPKRFQEDMELCAVSFKKAAKNYGLNDEKLREEYSSFIKNYSKLRNSREMDSQEIKNKDLKRESFHSTLQLMVKYNLQSAYPELFLLYKILVTLPIGSTNCERAFSKLKIIKNRLRSSMGQDCLSSLMLINVERDILRSIDYTAIIDTYASTPLLRKMLLE
eukprot:gene17877-19659_t